MNCPIPLRFIGPTVLVAGHSAAVSGGLADTAVLKRANGSG